MNENPNNAQQAKQEVMLRWAIDFLLVSLTVAIIVGGVVSMPVLLARIMLGESFFPSIDDL